jgi:hypothetical protein
MQFLSRTVNWCACIQMTTPTIKPIACHYTDWVIPARHIPQHINKKCLQVLKTSIFWDIKPCSLLKVSQCFGGTCHLHVQGQRINQAELWLLPPSCWFLACLTLQPWRWRRHVPLKCQLTFNRLIIIIIIIIIILLLLLLLYLFIPIAQIYLYRMRHISMQTSNQMINVNHNQINIYTNWLATM